MTKYRWLFVLIIGAMLVSASWGQSTGPKSLPSDAYQKWMQEDVAYILAPQERADFSTLKDDAEKDEFVRQFWLRRDPTVGTEENEFKEEHYRRIAYSNVHFAAKDAGWKSDRGRTYIVLGPPDDIAKGKTSMGVPWEQWSYRASPSNVRFEDRCSCGEFEQVK
jgi:GWxTD domain-containing protein